MQARVSGGSSVKRACLGLLLLLALSSCQGGLGLYPNSWSAWILPPVRTRGDWKPPSARDEQARLASAMHALLPRFQDCIFRHDARSFASGATTLRALNLQVGVDVEGRARWLELEGALDGSLGDGYSLHSCLSSVLLGLQVKPPPEAPALVMLHLPRLSMSERPLKPDWVSSLPRP